MIDIINSVIAETMKVPGLANSVFREFPMDAPSYPLAVVTRISSVPVRTGARGQELLARCTYSVDIYGKGAREVERMAMEASDRLSVISMHRTGMTDLGITEDRDVRTVSITVSGIVSADGHTYRE